MNSESPNYNDRLSYRLFQFALQVIDVSNDFPNKPAGWVISKQLVKCSSSVAANYRAARRARSRKEFYHKLCIIVEEADEALFWLELANESKFSSNRQLHPLIAESTEILKIMAKSRKTMKMNFTQG